MTRSRVSASGQVGNRIGMPRLFAVERRAHRRDARVLASSRATSARGQRANARRAEGRAKPATTSSARETRERERVRVHMLTSEE